MNQVLTIENSQDIAMTTVEVSELTGKRHDHVIRDTRKMLTELYGEDGAPKFGSAYLDAQGKERPCYRLPKTELLVLVSGYSIPLRAKIIRRLEALENHIAEQRPPQRDQVGFECELIGARICADMLNFSEASRLEMIHTIYENNNVPTVALPEYTPAVRITASAPDLLKENGCGLSAVAFNKLMLANGLLEERERTASKGRIKKFKALTEAGLKYGQNDASKHNPRAVHPHYFADTFMDLFHLITQEDGIEA